MNDNILLLLSRFFYYKPVELRKILEGFKNLEDVLEAPKDAFLKLGAGGKPPHQLDEVSWCGGKALEDFIEARKQKNTEAKKQEDIKIITIFDEKYPAALKNIYDPPPILFYKGNLGLLTDANNANFNANDANKERLAVIGSRKASEYGRRAVEFFAKDLAPHFTIVSGLAYGIDCLAHQAALSAGGKAIAVLGSGLDEASIYPKSNINLAKKIIDCGGLLLSEIPPGMGPQKFHFPMRNRIIAGISRGILIIEGGQKSGTLITAKMGLECGADIFAVPGSIFNPNSEGVNYLIKCGAHPITSAEDILEFYGIESKRESAGRRKEYAPKNQAEKNILENLAGEGRQTDELARLTGMAIIDLMGTLTDLEMEGAVKNINGRYIKL